MIKYTFVFLMALFLAVTAAPGTGRTQEISVPIQIEDSPTPVEDEEIDLLLFDGQLFLEEGDYANAAAMFTRAVYLAPDRLDGHLYLARTLTQGLMDDKIRDVPAAAAEAMRQYRWILERDPGHHEAQQGVRLLSSRFFGGLTIPLETDRGRRSWEAGLRALDTGDADGAADAFGQAAAAEPKIPEVHQAHGEALRLAGRPDEARQAFAKALELNARDAYSLGGIGQLDEAEGDTLLALTRYREAFEIDPATDSARDGLVRILGARDPESLGNDELAVLGHALLSAEKYDEAAAILEEAAAEDPTLENRKALGVAQFFRGRDTDATILLTGAHQEAPEDGEVTYYLAASLMRMGRIQDGQILLREALERNPDDASSLRLLGLTLADQEGAEEEAIELLERARRTGGAIKDLPCILGSLEMRLGHYDIAEREFRQCLEQSPDQPEAVLGLGIIADRTDRRGTAIVQYQKYLGLTEPDPGVIFRLGVAYLRVGQDEKGFDTLRGLATTDSTQAADTTEVTDTELLEMTTFFLATVRQHDDAIFIGEMLLTRASDNAIYNNNLAMSYADAGENPERALQLAIKANRLEPDNPGHMDTLGWTLLRLERYEEAEQTFREALQLAEAEGREDLSEIHYHLGYLYRLTGRHPEAKKHLNLALENPPTPYLRAEIERLLRLEQESARPR